MKKLVVVFLAVIFFFACSSHHNSGDSWKEDYHRRLLTDFCLTKSQIKQYIVKYIPDVTDKQMDAWESGKSLECMNIDGEKRYFVQAGPNLFRINSQCRDIKAKKNGENSLSGHAIDDYENIPAIIECAKQENRSIVAPKHMRMTFTITVNADAVPNGKMVRCWMPYPRTDIARQKDVRLISVSERNFILSPPDSTHSSLYMEKHAVKGKPTVFTEVFEFTEYGEYHLLKPEDIQPYDTSSSIYKKYTAQRTTHIIFTPRIRQLADSLTRGEINPLLKVKRIYYWINDHFPWASAREYSTIPNIPMYVLENHHGDCGQVSLLFITLCRACGIPAHFQSGLMLHPHGQNMHDWAEVYFQGVGWVPVDQSFGITNYIPDVKESKEFFIGGIDSYRLVLNNDFSGSFSPAKKYPRSETVDFQRGEVEWGDSNLYFPQWKYNWVVEYK